MSTTSRTRRVVTSATLVAAGALAATVVSGFAFASERPDAAGAGTAVQSSTAAGSFAGAPGERRGLGLRAVLHGELTVQTKDGTKVVDVQRGRITAVSSSSLSVASTDGFTATYAITSSTVVRKDRQKVAVGSLATGQEVLVRASAGTAAVVRVR